MQKLSWRQKAKLRVRGTRKKMGPTFRSSISFLLIPPRLLAIAIAIAVATSAAHHPLAITSPLAFSPLAFSIDAGGFTLLVYVS